jgi:nucleoside-diphosphate-sugar epimerase
MTRTVAITGSNGFVGRWLTSALLAKGGFTVVKVLRGGQSGSDIQSRGQPPEGVVADATSRSAWIDAGLTSLDVLVHLAAYMPKSSAAADDVPGALNGNVLFSQRLLDALPRTPGRIIYASTVDVYRTPLDGSPLTEDSAIGPASLYGASKYFAEGIAQAYCRSHEANLVIARVGHLYGPGEETHRKLVPTAIRTAIAGRAPTVLGNPDARRDLMYVRDAVEALIRIIDLDCKPNEVINLASGVSSTVSEILSLIAELAGSPPPQASPNRYVASRSVDVDVSYMCTRLGSWPMVALRDGLTAEIESYGGQG